jgi:Fe2+ transport system protein B
MESHLGCPVLPMSAVRRTDVEWVREQLAKLVDTLEPPSTRISYSNEVEDAINELEPHLREAAPYLGADERWTAVKLLEKNEWVTELVLERSEQTGKTLERVREIWRRCWESPRTCSSPTTGTGSATASSET